MKLSLFQTDVSVANKLLLHFMLEASDYLQRHHSLVPAWKIIIFTFARKFTYSEDKSMLKKVMIL